MLKRTLADFVQKQDQPVATQTPTLDSVLEEFQTFNTEQKEVKPGYNHGFRKQNDGNGRTGAGLKQTKFVDENGKGYQPVCQNSLVASPPLSGSRGRNYFLDDMSRGELDTQVKVLREIGQDIRVQRNRRSNRDVSIFEIGCNFNKMKIHKKQEYTVFDLQDYAPRKYTTCCQQGSTFKYMMEGQVMYEMEFNDDAYELKSPHSDSVSPLLKFIHRNEESRPDRAKTKSRKGTLLMTYCHYNKKDLGSKISYNYNFDTSVPYINSKNFNLKDATPSMLNTLIIDSFGVQICAVYEKEDKVFVESRSQDIPSHVVLMMTISRIDYRRRCCVRQ